MTVVALAPGHALAVCNNAARAYGATELLPGDVIVAIDGATRTAEMVEKLKNETSLPADIVRRVGHGQGRLPVFSGDRWNLRVLGLLGHSVAV